MIANSIHLYHLDAEVQKLYIKNNRYNKDTIRNEFRNIARLGFLLCKKNLFIPLSNYLESAMAFEIINEFSKIESVLNPLKILSNAPNLEVALQRKEQEHGDAFRENPNFMYYNFKTGECQLPGTFQKRYRNASSDIEKKLISSIGNDNIWRPVIELKCSSISYNRMEQELADIPKILAGLAYISEYIVPHLRFNKDKIAEANREINLRITRMYLESYLTENQDAVFLTDIPFVNASELLPEMPGRKHISYRYYAERLKAFVYKRKWNNRDIDAFQYISTCSINELYEFKNSDEWKNICSSTPEETSTDEIIHSSRYTPKSESVV